MSNKGMTYKQRTTHVLNRGVVSPAKFDTEALGKIIHVDGRVTSVYLATTEEFYGYVYEWLILHYDGSAERTETRYLETFDLDWSDRQNRITALNELEALNEIRRANGREWLPLFVEEKGSTPH